MRTLASLALVLLAAAAASGQDDYPARAEAFVSTDRVAPGGEFRIAARVTIEEGWHVQSNRPLDDGLIATALRFESEPGLRVAREVYPEGGIFDYPELGGEASLYEGIVHLGAVVAVASDATPGARTLRAALRVQACDDKACRQPVNLPLSFPIEIGDGEAKRLAADVFEKIDFGKAATTDPASTTAATPSGEGGAPAKGILATLLGIFLLGLALNLTPCVYPVIAVTVGFFGRQRAGSGLGRLSLPCAYALGIAATFTALGVAAALTGGVFGQWLQNRWVLLALAGVVFALALSCFGLFEIQPPTWLLAKVGGGKAGAAGAFLMGLTMGVTAAPCVGPLILALIVTVAQSQDVGKGLIYFGTLSVGLALPYVALGAFSGSIAAMPKAGDWTEWVKKLLGFVLVGVALWFASAVMPSEWFAPSLAALSVIAAIWLCFFEKSGREGTGINRARGIVLAAGIGLSLFLIGRARAEGIAWVPYREELVAKAAAEKRPVMIDFTAQWCVPCRVLEIGAFKDPEIRDLSRRFGALQVDMTEDLDENAPDPVRRDAASAVKRYGVVGPPTVVFLDAEGREVAAARLGESVGPGEFLRRMRVALGESKKESPR